MIVMLIIINNSKCSFKFTNFYYYYYYYYYYALLKIHNITYRKNKGGGDAICIKIRKRYPGNQLLLVCGYILLSWYYDSHIL